MPFAYIALLALAALSVSTVGAFFSITGLAKLFAGAPIAVMAMAGSLEFAKIVAAAFVHRSWAQLPVLLRYYLSGAIVVLVTITSMGIFGYLSHAYQATSEALKRVEVKMVSVDGQGQDVQKELARLQTIINMVPAERVGKRLETQKELEPRINELNAKVSALKTEQRDLQMQQLALQTEIGPLVYLAQVTGREPDQISKWLILMFVVVFDPLAICLVIATSFAVKLRAEEKARQVLGATTGFAGATKLSPEIPTTPTLVNDRPTFAKAPGAEDVA
ncbi:MAG: hypothetical protein V4760_11435 [Bdellovibrionota bacterium]